MTSWGPQGRRAAVSVAFETEGTQPSPALRTVQGILAERDLAATFFVDAALAAAEPLALTMMGLGRNEVGVRLPDDGDLAAAVAALATQHVTARGVRAAAQDAVPAAGLAALGLRFVSAPGEAIVAEDGVLRIPVDPRLTDPARHPGVWREALQVAIGRAVQDGAHLTVPFAPASLERADALGVLVETLDLVAGLRRAERLWTPTLGELAGWWLAERG